ncbi:MULTISPECIES: flagellar hook-length control protein FliK [unclassified Thermotoga]|uniref:flagellar hook-length control protein FliK n=1 Tax=unclassified Thermotoga TaxID=2631113 RepID=UPI000542C6F7|nr:MULTISPECIES: flagellar hook-length control protein FliK [unclassified Thermotoga]KAF2959847.1 flagellar hook-length control protein [Thermotoga sp. 38H-to]KHC90315.1 flagellar hook-length control protein [Thermotoga sp. Mc24]
MKVGQFSLFAMIKTAEEKGELKKKSAAGLFSQSVKDLMKSLKGKEKIIDSTSGKKKEIIEKKIGYLNNADGNFLNVQEKAKSGSSENHAEALKKTKRNVLDDLDGTSAQHLSLPVGKNGRLEETLDKQLLKRFQNDSEDQKGLIEEAVRSSLSTLDKEIKETHDESSEKHVLREISKRNEKPEHLFENIDENHGDEQGENEGGIFKSKTHDVSTEKLWFFIGREKVKENGLENKESAEQISFEKKHRSVLHSESEISRSESNKKLSSSFKTPVEVLRTGSESSLKSESTKVFKEPPTSAQDKEHTAKQPIFVETRFLPQNTDTEKLSRDLGKTVVIENRLSEEGITKDTGNEIKISNLNVVPLLLTNGEQRSVNGDGERVWEVSVQRISQKNFENYGLNESLFVNEGSINLKENPKVYSHTRKEDTHTEKQSEKVKETGLPLRNDGSSLEKNTRNVLNGYGEEPSIKRATPVNKFYGQKAVENEIRISQEKTFEKSLSQNREKNQPMEMEMRYEEKGKIESYREVTNREALEFLSQERAKQVYSLPELKRAETVHLPRFVEQMYFHKTERAVIDLEPPELGKLEITITKEENQLKIVFKVQTEEAKHVLEHDIPRLIGRFNEKGFDVQIYVEKQEEDYLYQENQNKEENQRQQRENQKDHKRETLGSLFEEFIQEVKT